MQHHCLQLELFKNLDFWHPEAFKGDRISQTAESPKKGGCLSKKLAVAQVHHVHLWSLVLLLFAAIALLQYKRNCAGTVKQHIDL